MIVDINVEHVISYLRKGSSAVHVAKACTMAPMAIDEAEETPRLAAAVKTPEGVDHYWARIGDRLYRQDRMRLAERLTDLQPPLAVDPMAVPVDDIGLRLKATKVIESDEDAAIGRMAAICAGLRLHKGRLYYPSKGPLLQIRPIEDTARGPYRRYETIVMEGYAPEPAEYPGRVFSPDEMVELAEFVSAMGYAMAGQAIVKVDDSSLFSHDLRDRALVDSAARLFDARNNNRVVSNLPYDYVEGYLAYHRPEFVKNGPHDELISILRRAVERPGHSTYVNAVRRRYLDMLDDVQCALCRLDGFDMTSSLSVEAGPLFK